jgi:hypothetical protein
VKPGLPLLALLAVAPLASCAARSAEEVRARRWIRGEPSTARQILALPYEVVAITGWPLETAIEWMEEVNLPARVGDGIAFSPPRSDEPEGQP